MSASEDFCGCGDYACGQCFGGCADAKGNAWLDQALVKNGPSTIMAKVARERLEKYGVIPDEVTP